ncbi:MAG: hypothetical protein GTO63_21475 [Anaerolineae bacterium]|nr:hypothetical protein [Anaerolineae bacterium]
MNRHDVLLAKKMSAATPPERYVSKQWAVVERMLAEGTITPLLAKELRKLVFLCKKVSQLMHTEESMGVKHPDDLHTRLARVERTRHEAQLLLDRLEGG